MEKQTMQVIKNKSSLTAILIISIFISGCASNFGSSETQDFGKYLSLKQGASHKTDVYDNFGQPADIEYFPNDESVWTYFAVSMTTSAASFIPIVGLVAGGSNMDTQVSKFFFDTDNLLLKIETSSKTQYVNDWVAIGTAFGSNDYAKRIEDEMEKFELPYDQMKAMEIKGMHSIAD